MGDVQHCVSYNIIAIFIASGKFNHEEERMVQSETHHVPETTYFIHRNNVPGDLPHDSKITISE